MNFKKLDKTTAELRLYGNIGNWFSDGEHFAQTFDKLEADGYTNVVLRLHCYGGSVFEGNVIANLLKESKLNISIVIDGIAASMGCFILPYLPANKVAIAANGFGMLHRPTSFSGGDADDHANEAKLLKDIEKTFIETLAQRTGKTKEAIKKDYFDGKDHWLNPAEMLALKLVGSISDKVADMDALDKQAFEHEDIETVYGKYFAKLERKFNLNQNRMDKNLIIAAFGLAGLTAESTDAEVVKALQEKIALLNGENERLKSEAKTTLESQINALIDGAIAEKRIAVPEGKDAEVVKASFRKVGMDSGLEALRNLLAFVPQATPQAQTTIMSQVRTASANGVNGSANSDKTFAWYREHEPETLKKMEKENPDQFKALYKAQYGVEPELSK